MILVIIILSSKYIVLLCFYLQEVEKHFLKCFLKKNSFLESFTYSLIRHVIHTNIVVKSTLSLHFKLFIKFMSILKVNFINFQYNFVIIKLLILSYFSHFFH